MIDLSGIGVTIVAVRLEVDLPTTGNKMRPSGSLANGAKDRGWLSSICCQRPDLIV